jgi:hypothetical protein
LRLSIAIDLPRTASPILLSSALLRLWVCSPKKLL